MLPLLKKSYLVTHLLTYLLSQSEKKNLLNKFNINFQFLQFIVISA